MFGGNVKDHLLVFMSKTSPDHDAAAKALRTVAAKNKGSMTFIFIDTDDDENESIMEFFGLTKEKTPTYRAVHLEDVSSLYTVQPV